MNKAVDYLKKCGTFYIATVEGDQPRVRAFGAVAEIDDKLYLATNNKKAVYHQMMENPKVEICAMTPENNWIRIQAEAVADDTREAKSKMLAANPVLTSMYNLDDGIFALVYLKNIKAKVESFVGEIESFEA
jgi:uncharacterized pyridoxamine 5'-phosphate oxidase family protein